MLNRSPDGNVVVRAGTAGAAQIQNSKREFDILGGARPLSARLDPYGISWATYSTEGPTGKNGHCRLQHPAGNRDLQSSEPLQHRRAAGEGTQLLIFHSPDGGEFHLLVHTSSRCAHKAEAAHATITDGTKGPAGGEHFKDCVATAATCTSWVVFYGTDGQRQSRNGQEAHPPRGRPFPTDPQSIFTSAHLYRRLGFGFPQQVAWLDGFFLANKHTAVTQLAVLNDPRIEKDSAQKMAEWFKPVRYGLCNGDGQNDFTGRMLQGWMGSDCFLNLVSIKLAPPDLEDVIKAISTVQYPPVPDVAPEVLQQNSMYPLVQVYQHRHEGSTFWFVRLHPNLRYSDSALGLDGTKTADWKKQSWGRATT